MLQAGGDIGYSVSARSPGPVTELAFTLRHTRFAGSDDGSTAERASRVLLVLRAHMYGYRSRHRAVTSCSSISPNRLQLLWSWGRSVVSARPSKPARCHHHENRSAPGRGSGDRPRPPGVACLPAGGRGAEMRALLLEETCFRLSEKQPTAARPGAHGRAPPNRLTGRGRRGHGRVEVAAGLLVCEYEGPRCCAFPPRRRTRWSRQLTPSVKTQRQGCLTLS